MASRPAIPKIVLIDADANTLSYFGGALTQRGYRVYTASTVIEGLKWIARYRPAVVVMDIAVGNETLPELNEKFKNRGTMERVWVYTNEATPEVIDAFFALGGRWFFIKSQFRPEEILQKLITELETIATIRPAVVKPRPFRRGSDESVDKNH